ncbi:MAG: hypothetical protein JW704_09230, partial [Anaerolineaceae bacterium]|nr:hypothetical protein [Anaerolineaceae bacterium]
SRNNRMSPVATSRMYTADWFLSPLARTSKASRLPSGDQAVRPRADFTHTAVVTASNSVGRSQATTVVTVRWPYAIYLPLVGCGV